MIVIVIVIVIVIMIVILIVIVIVIYYDTIKLGRLALSLQAYQIYSILHTPYSIPRSHGEIDHDGIKVLKPPTAFLIYE